MLQRCIYIALVIAAIISILLPMVEVSAQESTVTITITEAEINQSFPVTNPLRRNVTSRSVDLQPNRVVISETITHRRWFSAGTTTSNIATVFTPNHSDRRIYWTLESASVNGVAVSQALLGQFNTWLSATWSRYFREQLGSGRVTAITITDSDVTISFDS
jgi:hypothetical protein